MVFVAITARTVGALNITNNFIPLTRKPSTSTQGYVNIALTIVMIICAIAILDEASKKWYRELVMKECVEHGEAWSHRTRTSKRRRSVAAEVFTGQPEADQPKADGWGHSG